LFFFKGAISVNRFTSLSMHGKSVRLYISDVRPFIQGFGHCAVVVLHPKLSPHISVSSILLSVHLIILRHTPSTHPSLNPPSGRPYLSVISGPHSGMLLGRLPWHPNHRNRLS